MTDKVEIANMLDGMDYTNGIPHNVIERLRSTDVVIVMGQSDDMMSFDGAVQNEVYCYGGGSAFFTKNGLLVSQCDDDCPYFEEKRRSAQEVIAKWCDEPNISWTFKTAIPHNTFLVMEDGEKFCRGIVFQLSDIPERF